MWGNKNNLHWDETFPYLMVDHSNNVHDINIHILMH